MTNPYQCEDCTTPWPSLKAANECAILDAIEARQARRPSTRTTHTVLRLDND
jgi:hypothetical protein